MILLKSLHDPASAKPLLERALLIHEAALGPSHPAVGVRLSNLTLVHQDLGDVATAKALLERAVAILDALLGPDHPNTRAVRANLQNLRTA